jgi:hypothetical protein
MRRVFLPAVLAATATLLYAAPATAMNITIHFAADKPLDGFKAVNLPGDRIVYAHDDPILNSDQFINWHTSKAVFGEGVKILVEQGPLTNLSHEAKDQNIIRYLVKFDDAIFADVLIQPSIEENSVTLSGLSDTKVEELIRALDDAVRTNPRGIILEMKQRQKKVIPGGQLEIEIYASNLNRLSGYQVALAITGGSGAPPQVVDGWVDSLRDDYLFKNEVEPLLGFNRGGIRMLNALRSGFVDHPGKAYLGTFSFAVPSDAKGTFEFSFSRGINTLFADVDRAQLPVHLGHKIFVTID